MRWVRVYARHEAGQPYYPGAVSQWPAQYAAVMRVLADEARRIREAEAKAPPTIDVPQMGAPPAGLRRLRG